MINSKITGTGCYVPTIIQGNNKFLEHEFLNEDGSKFETSNDIIIEKFKSITGIEERRYASSNYSTSDLGFFAAQKAIETTGVNPEELDYIILAHNFGDVKKPAGQSDILPSLAPAPSLIVATPSADNTSNASPALSNFTYPIFLFFLNVYN